MTKKGKYIDRAALFNSLANANTISEVFAAIQDAPAVDVQEIKRGRWIWDDEGYHCSECWWHAYGNTLEITQGEWRYCPYCGAAMIEEEE
jgi:DNA-directed RNA polymerase subunit RPC12/RpoP